MYPSIKSVTANLKNINISHVEEMLLEYGWTSTMKSLGFRLDSYDYHLLAGRMLLIQHRMRCPKTIEEYVSLMIKRLNSNVRDFLIVNADKFNDLISEYPVRDEDHDWFSANSLINNYLACVKYGTSPIELPEIFYLRLASQMYYTDIDRAIECYKELVRGEYAVASPIAYNSGMKEHQMSSCFLYQVGDSVDSFTESWSKLAHISKYNGGNGIDMSKVRHSEISQVGMSSGVVPVIQVFNSIIRAINQTGKRKGAATIYLRTHHIDVESFCELSLKTGDHNLRAHDINTALWTSSIFWDRVETGGKWTLFCPAYTPELNDLYGEEFNIKYREAELRDIPSHARKTVDARGLLKHITQCQIQSSMPYILHADASNFKSNQKHRGYIPCSNLCLEIIEYSDDKEVASCNLSSISLRSIVGDGDIDYDKLSRISRSLVKNLNKTIDNNWSPIQDIVTSNMKHRPLGIGVSGFSDMLQELNLSFEDEGVLEVNKRVFACIYFNTMLQSVEEAMREGPYDSFKGSPLSEGKFQFDLWAEEYKMNPNRVRKEEEDKPICPSTFNQKRVQLSDGTIVEPTWESLREVVMRVGVRNSLLVALMPTATSSQILRNCEAAEGHMSNIYSRKVLSGAYTVLNRYMVRDLESLGLWNKDVIEFVQSTSGSLSNLDSFVKTRYPNFNDYKTLRHCMSKCKTMWELKQRLFLRLTADRARYVCQSQSTNLYLADPSSEDLQRIHQYTNALGLKTGMYYLRQRPSSQPLNFTLTNVVCDDNTCCSS